MGLVLQPYWSPGVRVPGPGGEGRGHRLGRRPHPGAPVPGDPRGPRVRPARGRRADRQADEGADHGAAGVRRREPEPGGRPADRGHLRAARRRGRTPTRRPGWARRSTPPSGWGCTRRSRRPSRAMTRIARDARPGPGGEPRSTRTSTGASTCGCTSGCGRCTRTSAGSRGTRRRSDRRVLCGPRRSAAATLPIGPFDRIAACTHASAYRPIARGRQVDAQHA